MRNNLFFMLVVNVINILLVCSLIGVAFNLMSMPDDFKFYGGIIMLLVIIAFETFVVYPLLKRLFLNTIK